MNSFVCIDTETLGLEVGSRVVELAAVRFDADGELDTFETFVHPGMPIPPDVSKIHGITDADVADAPDIVDAVNNFTAWLENRDLVRPATFIAHNAPFDGGVLSWHCAHGGVAMPCPEIIDTCAMAKDIGATRKNSLIALMEHYGIERVGDAHRALSDARGCAEFFRAVCKPQGTAWTAWRLDAGPHPYVPPDELPDGLCHLPDLVATAGSLSFEYQDAKGAATARTITPYGWGRAPSGELMFHGWCHMREARRSFRTDRVTAFAGDWARS